MCRRRLQSPRPRTRSPKQCSENQSGHRDRRAQALRFAFAISAMSTSNVQPMIEPDPQQMRRHVGHLFEGYLDGCQDGRIELAWTDGRDRKLKHAAIFGTDQLDDLVDRALIENRKPGQNVYVGQALRRPDIAPFGRCKDTEFFALTAYYTDIDDDVTATASINYRNRGCPPTGVVVTGKHPHLRAQMLWRLKTPLRDAEASRRQNLALAQALGGDESVVNPSRVLRLGGSIAWPLKEGRVIERTEFLEFDDGRPKQYLAEQIARAFPPVDVLPRTPAPAPAAEQPVHAPAGASLHIGSDLSVEACLGRIRAGDQWHNNLVRLTGHWIARGWSDAEILTAAEALTLSGYSGSQTRREVASMLVGGRRKWAIPNPDHKIDDERAAPALDLMAWTADRYVGEARPITWLCKGTIPLGIPALIAAMGGLGKSYLALDLALQIAAGVAGLEQPRLILGGRIAVEGTAVVISAEDSFDAIHRRLNRIDPTARRLRHPKRLIVLPLPDAGGTRPLITNNNKSLARGPFLEDLKRQLLEIKDLRLIVIDPLQAFVLADVNADPAAAQFLWSAMAEIASATGATVLLTHHMRKDGMMQITDGDGAREVIRGTTALVDGARLAYALWKLDDEAARPISEQLGLPFERGRLVRGAVVKANDETDHSAHTYRREDSGLLVEIESEPQFAKSAEPTFTKDQAREVLKEVERRFEAGAPFSHSPQGRARYLGHYLARQLRLTRKAAEQLIADWINNGVLALEVCNRKTKLTGLKVAQWI